MIFARSLLFRRLLVFLTAGGILIPGRLTAQAASVELQKPTPGACDVVVRVGNLQPTDMVGLIVARTKYPERNAEPGKEMTFQLFEPLRANYPVEVTVNGDGTHGSNAVVGSGPAKAGEKCADPKPGASDDVESPFRADFYLGQVFDNFAPNKIGNYQNPEAVTEKSQHIFGFDFDFHVAGPLYLYGSTMHGVRTADIDCSDAANRPAVCKTDGPLADRSRYILSHATSLEAYLNPRLEFWHVQQDSKAPASMYLTGRLGLIALDGAPSVFANHQIGIGMVLDDGTYSGSYIEYGRGKNELLSKDGFNRNMFDALLSYSVTELKIPKTNFSFGDLSMFVQATVDTDAGDGPDAVRTFIGFGFNPRLLSWK